MSTSYIHRGTKKQQLLFSFLQSVFRFQFDLKEYYSDVCYIIRDNNGSVIISSTKSDFKEINSTIHTYTGQILDKRNPEGVAKGM